MNPSTSFASSLRAHFRSTLSALFALFAAVAALCLLSAQMAKAEVTVFDSNQNYVDFMTASGSTSIAQQFRLTDPDSLLLNSVSLSIGAVSGTSTLNVIVKLRAESLVEVETTLGPTTNWPGTPLAVLYNGLAPTADQLWVIPVVTSPLLSIGTSYWISLSVSGEGSIDWNYTYRSTKYVIDGAAMANAITNNPYADGGNSLDTYYPQMMTVTTVPEPASWAMCLGGLFGLGFLRRFRVG